MNSETLPSSAQHASGGEYRMSPWLPWIIRLSAVGTTLFFGLLGLHSLRLLDFGPGYLSFVRWGSNSEAYELMICTIYLVWSAFLWAAARRPLQQKLFLDFTITANLAHFSVMFLQSLFLHGEHHHMMEDVLLGWVGLLVLMVAWIPARRHAR